MVFNILASLEAGQANCLTVIYIASNTLLSVKRENVEKKNKIDKTQPINVFIQEKFLPLKYFGLVLLTKQSMLTLSVQAVFGTKQDKNFLKVY